MRGAWVRFFFSSRRRHTRWTGDWSSDVCSSDLGGETDIGIWDVDPSDGTGTTEALGSNPAMLARTCRLPDLKLIPEWNNIPFSQFPGMARLPRYVVMWKIRRTDEFERRSRRYEKKHPRELEA